MSNQPVGFDLDFESLEAIASAATPGPWKAENHERENNECEYWNIESPYGTICGDDGFWWPPSMGSNEANAKFVAQFNPATVLALIAAARAAQAPQVGQDALTDAQITAGADVLCDCPKPKRIGRNAAIDVFHAMTAAGAQIEQQAAQALQGDTRQGAQQSEKEKLFDYLTDLATSAGFPNISTAIAEARWKNAGVHTCTPADERARREQENSEFTEWWNSKQACPEHSITTENAAHAAWQERGRRAAQGAGTAPVEVAMPDAPTADARLVLLLAAASGYEARHEYGRITPDQWGDILRVCEGKLSSTHPAPVSTAAATTASASGPHPAGYLTHDNFMRLALGKVAEILPVESGGEGKTAVYFRASSRAADGQQGASRAVLDPAQAFDAAIAAGTLRWDCRAHARAIAYEGFKAGAALARAPLPGQADGQAVDDARLEVFIDWYLREGKRAEINPYGHITRTTREHVLAWLDRAAQSRAQSDTTGDHNA